MVNGNPGLRVTGVIAIADGGDETKEKAPRSAGLESSR